MKNIITFIALLYSVSTLAQNETKLFYFIKKSKDTLDVEYIGVKDETGKIIIPVEMLNISEFKDSEVINDKLLSFYGCPKSIKKEKQSFGCVFDRKGNYLYQTFFFDNGADYRVEGYQRIVKNGKMGFANRNGKIVIQPQFDFVTPFSYGYAQFCSGCHWKDIDQEHKTVAGGQWGVINFQGEKILPLKTKQNKNAIKIRDKYYPYPFSYSKKEQKILDFFNEKMKLLADIEYVNWYNKLNDNEKVLYFEIVERPSKDFPFYVVYAYDYRRYHRGSQNTFLVSQDGNSIFHRDFFEEKIPFEKWLEKKIQWAKEYQKKTTDNPNKFIK